MSCASSNAQTREIVCRRAMRCPILLACVNVVANIYRARDEGKKRSKIKTTIQPPLLSQRMSSSLLQRFSSVLPFGRMFSLRQEVLSFSQGRNKIRDEDSIVITILVCAAAGTSVSIDSVEHDPAARRSYHRNCPLIERSLVLFLFLSLCVSALLTPGSLLPLFTPTGQSVDWGCYMG